MKFSSTFSINLADLSKGLLMTFITAALTSLVQLLQDGKLPTVVELKTAGVVGLTAGVSYIVKNFLTGIPSQIVIDPAKTAVVEVSK